MANEQTPSAQEDGGQEPTTSVGSSCSTIFHSCVQNFPLIFVSMSLLAGCVFIVVYMPFYLKLSVVYRVLMSVFAFVALAYLLHLFRTSACPNVCNPCRRRGRSNSDHIPLVCTSSVSNQSRVLPRSATARSNSFSYYSASSLEAELPLLPSAPELPAWPPCRPAALDLVQPSAPPASLLQWPLTSATPLPSDGDEGPPVHAPMLAFTPSDFKSHV